MLRDPSIWRTIMPRTVHFAAQRGDVAALQRELDDGVSPNVLDRCGWTPLHYLCQEGDNPKARLDCVHMLLEAGANVNAPSVYRVDLGPEDGEPDEAVTPLHQLPSTATRTSSPP